MLFLAEKLAALEVVNQRLERQGLGVLCLELHSNKARKSAVAGELKATWDLGNPSADGLNNLNDSLARQRASLNEHAHRFHAGPTSTQPSTFDHIGTLSYHGLPHGEEAAIQFPGAEQWLNQDIDNQKAFLSDLVIRLETVGDVRVHPWRGVALTRYTGLERQRLGEIITRLIATLDAQLQTASQLAQVMQTKAQNPTLVAVSRLQALAEWVQQRPVSPFDTHTHALWDQAPNQLVSLARTRLVFEQLSQEFQSTVRPIAWQSDWQEAQHQLALHGQKWYKFLIGGYRQAINQLTAQVTSALPSSYEAKMALVNRVVEGQ